VDEEEGDVDDEEDGHEQEQLPHDGRKVGRGGEGGKVMRRVAGRCDIGTGGG